MKTKVIRHAAFCIGALTAIQLGAVPLTLNTPGVVGSVSGQATDNQSDEIGFAQYLLDLPKDTLNHPFESHLYNTSSTEYDGLLAGAVEKSGTSVTAGWDYALAKYDGENAGYVMFWLNQQPTVLPQFSYSIWGDNPGQYEISHFTVFTAAVPENGRTVGLLGLGLLLIAFVRRILPG